MKNKLAIAMTAMLLASLATPALARLPRERIAFVSFKGFSTGVRSVKPNGEGRKTITRSGHINPQWSPDRSTIVFERAYRGEVVALLFTRPGEDGIHGLADVRRDPYKEGFDWSPDGTKVVYTTITEGSSTQDIYVVDVSSRETTRLTEGAGDEYEPVWSPDGTKIAYTARPEGPEVPGESKLEIAVMDADGSNETLLTEHPHADYSPQWSPDGSQISFISERDDEYANNPDIGPSFSEIYVMDATGENERRVTNHMVLKDEYEWSPDGTRFAYMGRCDIDVCDDRETDIYTIGLDGTGRRNLTRSSARSESSDDIEWSPNGRWVAYVWVQRGGRSQDIMLAKANGPRTLTRVTDTPRRGEGDLDW